METEKHKGKQGNKEEEENGTMVISSPAPQILQNVADVAGGKHSASAERLAGQHVSSSGGNMSKAPDWETGMLTM